MGTVGDGRSANQAWAVIEEPDAESWAMPIAWAKRMSHTQILKLLEAI